MSKAEPELWRLVPSVSGLLASSHGSLMVTPYCAPMPFGGERQYGGEPTQGQLDGKRFIQQLSGALRPLERPVRPGGKHLA